MAEAPVAAAGRFSRLAGLLDPGARILVQTHDYPDIDAVAAAWAIAELLRRRGRSASVAHRGQVRSRSLSRLVAELGIVLSTDAMETHDAMCDIVVVDGSPANGNVTLFPGRLVGVVDHHCVVMEPDAPFLDLRPEAASCSSMAFGYWVEAGETPPGGIATALIAGIQSDTDFLSRRSSSEDFAAYTALLGSGDWELASRIVRTTLDLRELGLIAGALSRSRVQDGLLYAQMEGSCGQEALAVAADFALRAEEIRVAVVTERDETGMHFSVRSKSPRLSAFTLVRRALEGIGSGGGHSHSAGGIVATAAIPSDAVIRERFFASAAAISTKD
jgi:nanoRNase/pAp phosphatase (c-di-AMP/oligoRNAs hydrolase)